MFAQAVLCMKSLELAGESEGALLPGDHSSGHSMDAFFSFFLFKPQTPFISLLRIKLGYDELNQQSASCIPCFDVFFLTLRTVNKNRSKGEAGVFVKDQVSHRILVDHEDLCYLQTLFRRCNCIFSINLTQASGCDFLDPIRLHFRNLFLLIHEFPLHR